MRVHEYIEVTKKTKHDDELKCPTKMLFSIVKFDLIIYSNVSPHELTRIL